VFWLHHFVDHFFHFVRKHLDAFTKKDSGSGVVGKCQEFQFILYLSINYQASDKFLFES